MLRGHRTFFLCLLCVALFAGVNLVSARWLAPVRVDFTSAKLYTLSQSAREILGRLGEPVRLTLVHSRGVAADYPAIRAHAARVNELLREIAAASGGKVRIDEIDPEPFSEAEDRILGLGLQSVSDTGDPLYFGVIGRNSVDDEIVIPFLSPDRDPLLEYDLIRLVSQLDKPEPPRIAVLSGQAGFEGDGLSPQSPLILREMARAFRVIPVDPDFIVLPDADVLMLVHPPELDAWQAYQIDQFLMRKGRLLAAFDPVNRTSLVSGGRRARMASPVGRLQDVLGVSVSADAVADRSVGLPVEVADETGRRSIEAQPLFPAPTPAMMSRSDPVTADLTRAIHFGAPGRLEAMAGLSLTLTPLVETSPEASFISSQDAARDIPPREVALRYQPLDSPQILAARLSGPLASAFADARPRPTLPDDPVLAALAEQEIAGLPPPLAKSVRPVEAVLIADADMLEDGFYVNPATAAPVADNAAFILNALDNLAGDEALVALRSRAPAQRPMVRIEAMRNAARERLYAEQTALEERLQAAEGRLEALRGEDRTLRRDDPAWQAQQAEIDRSRREAVEIRARLRAIEREFRRDIDRLAGWLEFCNVWLPPLGVGAIGLALFAWRSRKRNGSA